MKSLEIMKSIDQALFQNIEKLKQYDQYQSFLESYNNWEEKQQELFKSLLLALIITVPLFVFLIFFSLNQSAKNHLEMKYDILKVATKISTQKSELNTITRKVLGTPITTKQMLMTQVQSSFGGINIEPSKVSIIDFDTFDEAGINKTIATFKFSELSNQNLNSLFKLLAIQKKMRIEEVDIKKNKQTNLLEGTIVINHYSRLTNSADDE